jgi:hypothetical protein
VVASKKSFIVFAMLVYFSFKEAKIQYSSNNGQCSNELDAGEEIVQVYHSIIGAV